MTRVCTKPYRHHTAETRIGACADYLLGNSWYVIEHKWGVHPSTVASWIRKTGHFKLRNRHSEFSSASRRAFSHQKSDAKRRGVHWELNLDQWWSVWQQSGKWEQRGTGQGYVMCRPGDVGPYSIDNVFIALARQNSSDHPNRKKSLPMGVFKRFGRKTFQARRKLGGKRLELGTYSTAEEAHAAYLAVDGTRS